MSWNFRYIQPRIQWSSFEYKEIGVFFYLSGFPSKFASKTYQSLLFVRNSTKICHLFRNSSGTLVLAICLPLHSLQQTLTFLFTRTGREDLLCGESINIVGRVKYAPTKSGYRFKYGCWNIQVHFNSWRCPNFAETALTHLHAHTLTPLF